MANPFLTSIAPVKKNPFLDGPAPQQGPEMPSPEQIRASKLSTEARLAQPEMGAGDIFRDSYTLGLQRPVAGAVNAIGGTLRNVFGAGDDSTIGERYQAGKEGYDMALAKAEAESGNLGTAAAVTGSLMSPAGPVGGKGKLVTKAAQGVGVGAIEGAARSDDSLGDTAKGALTGGAFGLGGTLIGEGVGKVAEIGMQKVGQAIQNFRASPSLRARLDIFRAGQEAGLTRQQVNEAAQRMGVEGMAVDVLGTHGTALGRRSANLSPEARETLEGAMAGRKAGQNARVAGTIEDAAGVPRGNRTSVDEFTEAVRRDRQPAISKAYKEASAAGYDLPRTPFENLHKAPMFAKAYKEAEQSLLNRTATDGMDAASELARLDETKKILDSIGTSAKRSGDLNTADQAQGLSRQLRETMDQTMAGPEYSSARSAASKSFADRRAIRRGADLAGNRIPLNAPRDAAATTDATQRQLQKGGYAIQQTENLLNKGSTDAAPSLLERPLQQEALSGLFDPDELASINQRLGVERGFNRTAKDLTGNSSTARQIAELAGGAMGGAGFGYLTGQVDPLTGGVLGAAAGAGKLVSPLIKKKLGTQAVTAAPEIARLLTLPADQLSLERPVIENMMERAAPATRAVLSRLLMRATVAGGTQ